MKKYLILAGLLAAAEFSFAQSEPAPKSNITIDTLMIQTVYINSQGVELMEPVKTVRIISKNRSGQETVYFALDPHIETRVRRRIIQVSEKF
ncbi:hypothetical protein [Siphonobacter sp. SORGH_AS_0500]|uniref:hypothetical protein n=1 Tax=Siphonobacter sp. SORGH_AS_0500 TaxID=1864824 RepID=UPI0028670A4F|nr:hypothetical protein [Siphonobacter sp. SORGH_AS_0500]MDR6196165.1 hypothetical protein [Siphonobacter sp. SORGH_AS_0500]